MRNAGNIPEVVLSAQTLQHRRLRSGRLLARLAREGRGAIPQRYDLPAHCA